METALNVYLLHSKINNNCLINVIDIEETAAHIVVVHDRLVFLFFAMFLWSFVWLENWQLTFVTI